jgi:hypothetical protein
LSFGLAVRLDESLVVHGLKFGITANLLLVHEHDWNHGARFAVNAIDDSGLVILLHRIKVKNVVLHLVLVK